MSLVIIKTETMNDSLFRNSDPDKIITLSKHNIDYFKKLSIKYQIDKLPVAFKQDGDAMHVYQGKEVYSIEPLSVLERAKKMMSARVEI
jgi:hypothetical protein